MGTVIAIVHMKHFNPSGYIKEKKILGLGNMFKEIPFLKVLGIRCRGLNMLCKHSVSYIPRNITFNKKRAG
jgi:hypothetical protein